MADSPRNTAEDLEKEAFILVVRKALDVAQAIQPIPKVLIWLAVVLIAAVIFAVDRINFMRLLKDWQKSATPGPIPTAPPMEMPKEGMNVPGPKGTDPNSYL